jgi:hypothetical protein
MKPPPASRRWTTICYVSCETRTIKQSADGVATKQEGHRSTRSDRGERSRRFRRDWNVDGAKIPREYSRSFTDLNII